MGRLFFLLPISRIKPISPVGGEAGLESHGLRKLFFATSHPFILSSHFPWLFSPPSPTTPLSIQRSTRLLSFPVQWHRIFSSRRSLLWRRGRECGYPGRDVGGGSQVLAHPALSPRSDSLARVPPELRPLINPGHSARLLPGRPFLLPLACGPPPSHPLPTPQRRSGSAVLGVGPRRGGDKTSGGRRRLRGATAARERPTPCARAPSQGLGGGRSCGRRGRRSSRQGGRSERWAERRVGGRARAGEQASERRLSQHLQRLPLPEAQGLTDGPTAWRTDAGACFVFGASFGEAWACSARLPRSLAATPAPAASAREGLEVREPLSAGRSPRG